LRLRRRLHAAVDAGSGEAILSPAGDVLHATGPGRHHDARLRLREAALAAEQARGPLRRSDAVAATQLWPGLVAGRWSIVDRFDSEGRRFLVAHRNAPECRGPRALTLRERQVLAHAQLAHSNKLIAYELGLSIGAVSTYLSAACAKLGVHTRAELVELAARLDSR
jgi:DNA-binding CsgD family transcriptional regulator